MKVANTKLEADTANMFLVGDVAKAVSPYYTYPLTSWYGSVWSLIDLYSLFDQWDGFLQMHRWQVLNGVAANLPADSAKLALSPPLALDLRGRG